MAFGTGGFNFGATANQPATPGFGSSTPGFGAGSSTPAFGISNSPIGGPSSSTPASTSLFGATTPSGGLFGAPATPAPAGGLGATTTTGQGTSSFSFGNTANTSGGGGGLFGGGAGTGTGLFGGTSTATATTSKPAFSFGGGGTGGSLFGGGTSTGLGATTSGGLFGSAQPASAGVGAQSGGSVLQGTPLAGTATGGASISHDISTISELQSIAAAANCAPENQEYKLRTLFLNVVGDPAARIKPTTVDERQWTEALEKAGGEDNADRLWPVPAVGFRDLRQRAEAQLAAEKDDRERVAAVRGLLRRSEQLRASEITRRLEAAQQRHAEQLYRLLKLLRCLDGLEGRLSVHGASETNESTVRELEKRLSAVEHSMGPASSATLLSRASTVAALSRSRGRTMSGASGALKEAQRHIRPKVLDEAFEVLSQQLDAIRGLQDLLSRDEKDLAVLGEELARDTAGSRRALR